MDTAGLAALIVAIMGAIGTTIGGLLAAWKWAKTQAKAEWLREQSAATIRELETDNAELKRENAELRVENQRLWGLVPEAEKPR